MPRSSANKGTYFILCHCMHFCMHMCMHATFMNLKSEESMRLYAHEPCLLLSIDNTVVNVHNDNDNSLLAVWTFPAG